MYFHARFGLILVLMLLCATETVWAQSSIIRPRRLVKLFDFEEPDNYESLPKNWFIIGRPAETTDNTFFREPLHHELMERPGYPSFTEVRFDQTHATSGQRCLYLGLNGGSAGAFLEVGTIPSVPQSDYLVTAAVRTEDLKHASAYLTVYFVDRQGQRIEASVTQSQPIRTWGEWTQVALKLRGDIEGAVWIGMEAELRQPKRDPDDPLGAQRILLKDIEGKVWFDDISIWQLPRIEVATQSKVNLIRDPQKPELAISVRDLTGQNLYVQVVAYDYQLKPAAVDRRKLGVGAPRFWTWQPDLPGYGWYLVDMQVRDENAAASSMQTPIARTFGAFVWLPPNDALNPVDAQRFKLIASDLSDEQMNFLPQLLEGSGIRSTVLSVWERSTTLSGVEKRKDRLDEMMQWLYLSGRSAALSLDPVPRSLADAVNMPSVDPLSLLGTDRSQWLAYLTPTLLSHGQRIHRWCLGSPDQAYAFYDQDLPEMLDEVYVQFSTLAPSPELVIPWRADQARRSDMPESTYYLMDVPPSIVAEELPTHLEQWRDIKDRLTLHLREPPANHVSHARRVTDMAIRMMMAWEYQPETIAVSRLWTQAAQRETAIVPDPLLGVFANMAHELSGRRVIGKLELGGGLEVRILDGPAGPALVTWAQQPGSPESILNLYMGQNPVAKDVWGNQSPIPLINGKHQFQVPETPVFITGIDADLAMFRAGFTIDEPFIDSTRSLHDRVFTLTNPWSKTISGYMRITGPQGWESRPTRHYFSIPAGRSMTLPTALTFPVSEVAGHHTITARFEFNADEPMEIDMSLPVEVGLKDVRFNGTVALNPGEEPGTEDATASAVVTNTGSQKLSLYVFANLPGHPIQERIVAELDPGESAVRHFRFPGAGQALRDNAMRLGVREVDGPRMLNQRFTISEE